MNRRILPLTIVIVTLTLVFGMLQVVRLYAGSTAAEEAGAAAQTVTFTVVPTETGRFTQPSTVNIFNVTVANTGDAATDTYELQLDPTPSWTTGLFGPDGTTPLTDTNGSGGIDTGIVPLGASFTVIVKTETPSNALVGDANQTVLTVRSTISPSLVATSSMQNAVPAPFAQALYQQSSRAMSLIMTQPYASWRSQTTGDGWYSSSAVLADLAVEETATGYAYAWNNLHGDINFWWGEVEFVLTDKAGVPVSDVVKLTDLSQVTDSTWDKEPALAVAPNGNIGVVWYREIEQDNADRSQNYNVYLSILDEAGQPVTDTINVTNNDAWRDRNDPDELEVPRFGSPRIAATRDNHFFLAWASSVVTYTEKVTETDDLDDIYYAIYASDGVSITEPINVSNNLPGQVNRGLAPATAPVGGDRVFLSWAQRRPPEQGGDNVLYTVINSTNAIIKTTTEMAGADDTVEWWNYDIVELSTGKIIAAWQAFGCPDYEWSARIRYAVFGANNYVRTGPPSCLPATIIATDGDEGVSLTADDQGHAIVTWTDRGFPNPRKRLYYALLNPNGNVATDPMIFFESGSPDKQLSTGLTGYGSASRVFLDLEASISPASAWSMPSDPVSFTLGRENSGTLSGTNVVMTLTLAPSLTYVSDSLPTTPVVNGEEITWALPDISPLSQAEFEVQVTVGVSATFGHSYPLTVTLSGAGQDVRLANNSDRSQIVVGRPLFLPALVKLD